MTATPAGLAHCAPADATTKLSFATGDTGHPNLHYCDWIRDWTDTCLRIFGTVTALNPGFLQQFAERKAL
jgi:hypothetical protein